MSIIAVANQKGGVGKTTTVVNLGTALARKGKTVLCIDFDPQANLTSYVACEPGEETVATVMRAAALFQPADIGAAVCHSDKFGFDFLPADLRLSEADIYLATAMSRETVLRRMLEPLRQAYDYILIDCSPSLGYTTVNILTAADTVLIPVQCEYLALEGLSKLLNTIRIVKNGLNPALEIEGFVLTMYMRNRLNNQVVNEVRNHFGELAFDTIIQRNIRLGEAPSHGKPVILYDASAVGSANYLTLAKELLKRNRKSNQKAK